MVTDLWESCQPEETNLSWEVLKSAGCGTTSGMFVSSKYFITSGKIPDWKDKEKKVWGGTELVTQW